MSPSAVLQTSFLGDMILTTPLLARLAAEGPVHVVATPANADVLRHHPAVASVIVYDKRGADRGVRGLWRVARALRATGARRAFMAQGSLRTAALAVLAGIPERVGFDTSAGRWLYTQRRRYDRTAHHATRLWSLSAGTGLAAHPAVRPSLYPDADDQAVVSTLLADAGIDAKAPLLALAPGSVWATKRWPHFAALASQLARQPVLDPPFRLIVIGSAADGPLAREIAGAVAAVDGAPVIDATGRLSLLQSAALLSRCRAVVTNDSAPLHLASAMDVPTVALFGPTVPAMGFGPLATRSAVGGDMALPCRPCHAHGPMACPLEHWRCLRDLTPDVVIRLLHHVITL